MVYTIVLFQKNTNSGGGLEDISSCIEERACKDSRGQLTLYGAEVVLIIKNSDFRFLLLKSMQLVRKTKKMTDFLIFNLFSNLLYLCNIVRYRLQ